jgi:hypothetical protein
MRNFIRKAARSFLAGTLLTIACSPIRTFAPPPTPSGVTGLRISRLDAIAETDTMLRIMEDVHPDLYASWPKDSVHAARARMAATLPETLSRADWWLRLSSFVARFGDGHTNIGYPSDEVARAEGREQLFPSTVGVDASGHLRVVNPFEPGLARGDRVVALNNLNVDSLVNAWSNDVSGESPAFRATVVAIRFRDLVFLRGLRTPWTIDVLRNETARTVSSVGLPHDSLVAIVRRSRATTMITTQGPQNFSYRVFEPGVGYMNLFSLSGSPAAFSSAVSAMFEQLARDSAHTLVVDLRTNGGGDSRLGDELLRHFTTIPYRGSARKDWRMSKEYRAFFKSFVRPPLSWLPAEKFFSTGRKLFEPPDGTIVSLNMPIETPTRAEPFFTGAVCVLTGPLTFSSAVDLADAIKTYHLATLVGEETGGRPNGFGEVYWFLTARSGLLASVSSAKYVRASGDTTDHRGVIPDIAVHSTEAERREGRDVALERAAARPH